eukprot:CAMPEP_0178448794 /NCGR_PEP_ID=MMETSP0689_2-20121128/42188_1 /TAXON_ID=160604 /ORGANISM="Amphidinium massartii, Strain CS-259" /LENGTH=657 /DNA_ID=CAMNT_0020074031 /DNA_START=17 /DNA_END=1991 /DNA_ORIENTATION=+
MSALPSCPDAAGRGTASSSAGQDGLSQDVAKLGSAEERSAEDADMGVFEDFDLCPEQPADVEEPHLAAGDSLKEALDVEEKRQKELLNRKTVRRQLDRVYVDAAAVVACKRPKLPWERGFLGGILSSSARSGPSIPCLSPLWLEDLDEPLEEEVAGKAEVPKRLPGALLGRHSQSGDEPLSWLQAKDALRTKEVSLWLKLLLACPHGSEVGRLLEEKRRAGADSTALAKLLGAMLASRDPLTLGKHRAAIQQYLVWREGKGLPRTLPAEVKDVADYLEALWSEAVAGSRTIQFFKTCLFCGHVLGIPKMRNIEKSAVLVGFTAQARKRIKRRLKRRALSAEEVRKLESIVCDETGDPTTRIISGAFLCGLYARARWHELAAVQRVRVSGEPPHGFLEMEVSTVKTAAQHLRGQAVFHMIAVSQGILYGRAWAPVWMSLRERAGLAAETPGGVIETPLEDNKWENKPLTVGKARAWLLHILQLPSTSDVGTHSLKATLLRWSNIGGLSRESRRALGYHRGKERVQMEDLYGRDEQAGAARLTTLLTAAVRKNLLDPDKGRAGFYPNGFAALARELCLAGAAASEPAAGEDEEQSQESSASEAASERSEEEMQEAALDTDLYSHKGMAQSTGSLVKVRTISVVGDLTLKTCMCRWHVTN